MLDARLERADAVDEPNNEEFSQLFATIKIFAGICDAVLERKAQPVLLCTAVPEYARKEQERISSGRESPALYPFQSYS